MPFVLDASVTMAWCFADESTPYTQSVLKMLEETHAEVPALWHLEVANVLAVNERKGRITAPVADEFLKMLADLDIRTERRSATVNAPELMFLIRLHGLTAYDVAYLEIAKRRGFPLATLDAELIQAASNEGVNVAALTR